MSNETISVETVEAACAAFYNDPSGLTSWERATRVSPAMADRYRASMTRALKATATHMLAEAWEAGAKAGHDDAYAVTPETPNPYRSQP